MRRSAMAVVMAVVAMVLPSAAAAATPEPAWTISVVPYPSSFEAGSAYGATKVGPAYLIQAYNAGAKPTPGPFILSDALPVGLLPAPGFPPSGLYGPQQNEIVGSHAMTCTTLVRKVTCTGGGAGETVGP